MNITASSKLIKRYARMNQRQEERVNDESEKAATDNTDELKNLDEEIEEATSPAQVNVLEGIKTVLKNPRFLLVCDGMTCLHFIAAGILITSKCPRGAFTLPAVPSSSAEAGGYIIAYFGSCKSHKDHYNQLFSLLRRCGAHCFRRSLLCCDVGACYSLVPSWLLSSSACSAPSKNASQLHCQLCL